MTLLVAALLRVPVAAAQTDASIEETVDPYMARIREALRLRAPAFRACFEQALRRNPALTGRTQALRFRVLPTGRVQAIEVLVAPRAPAIERCMTGVLERIVLPPHRGAAIEVTYPLT